MFGDEMPEMGDEVKIGLNPIEKKKKFYTVTFDFANGTKHTAYLVPESDLESVLASFVFDGRDVKLTIEKDKD